MLTRTLLTICLLACTTATAWTQNYGLWAKWVKQRADKLHISPRPCDDVFAGELLDAFLNELDPKRNYFTAEEVAGFKPLRTQLDDHVLTGDGLFLDHVTAVYTAASRRADSIAAALLAKPFDFSQADTYHPDPDQVPEWAPDPKALTLRWRANLKRALLGKLFAQYTDSTGYKPAQQAALLSHEAEARALLARIVKADIQRSVKDARTTVGEAYLRSIAGMYDPHSSWFTFNDKENFSAGLSSERLSFGIYVNRNSQGEVEIAKVVPGGPAWRCGELHAGDVLQRLQTTANAEEEEVAVLGVGEVMRILEDGAVRTAKLEVRKKNGHILTVTLQKEALRADDNLVKSLVLEAGDRIGYIQLPGFYMDFEGGEPKGCATDVAKEVLKLQKENVKGIILDLRFNGGGSMFEAMQLAGIFIDGGSLWVAKDNVPQRTIIKDPHRGAVYTGPLLVLVNGASASASEFLCSTLQDHRRAIIVGTTTYGKATGQGFMTLHPNEISTEAGYLKLTQHRYYRLDGTSHQVRGIQPDITLADPFAAFMPREEDLPHVLSPDTVVKKVYFTPLAQPDLGGLAQKSAVRMAGNAQLAELEALSATFDQMVHPPAPIVLQPKTYFPWLEQRRVLFQDLDDALENAPVSGYAVRGNQFDEAVVEVDAFARDMNQDIIGRIQKDFYISECVAILHDLIHP